MTDQPDPHAQDSTSRSGADDHRQEAPATGPSTAFQPAAAPPVPANVVGREDDLRNIKLRLGVASTNDSAPAKQPLTIVRGWPGVGKTTFAAVLAHDPEIHTVFPDGILWASLGQHPSVFAELAIWGRALGLPQLDARTTEEAVEQLRGLLRHKRMLLIVDDVWQAEDGQPFLQVGGDECALLITTRRPEVAQALGPDATYVLGVLSEEAGVSLLQRLTPAVVAQYPTESRDLVSDLEGLPLALHVAGQLLNAESNAGLSVVELLRDIREGAKLIEAQAPADRAEIAQTTPPPVAALLKKSTDLLDAPTLDCFAYLGAFAPKPATFDMAAMGAVWEVEHPQPIVRMLVNHGLLEPTGAERFWLHAILVAHARSFLTD